MFVPPRKGIMKHPTHKLETGEENEIGENTVGFFFRDGKENFHCFPRSHTHRQSKRHFMKRKKWVTEIGKFSSKAIWTSKQRGKSLKRMKRWEFSEKKKRVVSLTRWQTEFRQLYPVIRQNGARHFFFSNDENLVDIYFKIFPFFMLLMSLKTFKREKWVEIELKWHEKHPEIRFFSYAFTHTHSESNVWTLKIYKYSEATFFATFRGTFERQISRFPHFIPYWFVLTPFNFVFWRFLCFFRTLTTDEFDSKTNSQWRSRWRIKFRFAFRLNRARGFQN